MSFHTGISTQPSQLFSTASMLVPPPSASPESTPQVVPSSPSIAHSGSAPTDSPTSPMMEHSTAERERTVGHNQGRRRDFWQIVLLLGVAP